MYVSVCPSECMCARYQQVPGSQKKLLDPSEMELQGWWAAQCGCWEQNSGPLKEPQVLLPDEPSLWPHLSVP